MGGQNYNSYRAWKECHTRETCSSKVLAVYHVLSCFDEQGSVVRHDNASVTTLELVWNAPSGSGVGDIRFVYVLQRADICRETKLLSHPWTKWLNTLNNCRSLTTWPLFMAALCNRAGHYIFALMPCGFFLLLSIYLSIFFPRLISAATDWMSTILLHMAWP